MYLGSLPGRRVRSGIEKKKRVLNKKRQVIQSDLLIPRSPTGKGLPGVVFLSLGQGWVVLISFLIKCQLKRVNLHLILLFVEPPNWKTCWSKWVHLLDWGGCCSPCCCCCCCCCCYCLPACFKGIFGTNTRKTKTTETWYITQTFKYRNQEKHSNSNIIYIKEKKSAVIHLHCFGF